VSQPYGQDVDTAAMGEEEEEEFLKEMESLSKIRKSLLWPSWWCVIFRQ